MKACSTCSCISTKPGPTDRSPHPPIHPPSPLEPVVTWLEEEEEQEEKQQLQHGQELLGDPEEKEPKRTRGSSQLEENRSKSF